MIPLYHALTLSLVITRTLGTNWAPPNYAPSASQDIIINYGGTFPENGGESEFIGQFATPPNISVNTTLPSDQTYMLIMIDASIPFTLVSSTAREDNVVPGLPPPRTTFLQWLQTNLTQTPFTNFSSTTQPIAPYRPPNPQPTDDPTPHTFITYLFPQPSNFTFPAADANRGSLSDLNAKGRFNFSVTAIGDEVGPPVAAHYNVIANPAAASSATPTFNSPAATSSAASAATKGKSGARMSVLGVAGLAVLVGV